MADSGSVATTGHGPAGHPSHVGRYAAVWLALTVLTFTTWGVSRFHIHGVWAILVALLIAGLKGGLVALFFMHLYDQPGANRLVFVTSLLFVALLVGIVLSDNATRFALANPPGAEGALPYRATDYEAMPELPARAPGGAPAER